MYQILGDRVLIKLLPLETIGKYQGMKLVLPENAKEDVFKQPTAVVQAVGEGRLLNTGVYTEYKFKVGDVVFVNIPPSAVVIEFDDGFEHVIISAMEVIAIVTDKAEKARQLALSPIDKLNASIIVAKS